MLARISSAVLVHTKGVSDAFVMLRYSRMVSSRARVLRCAPRWICLFESNANQRSTRLSHDALVGVKWR